MVGLVFLTIFMFWGYGSAWAQSPYRLSKVVLDAGHGGKDPGAVGKISYEKNIVLSITKKLGAYIQQAFADVEVIYTRKNDVFVELFERANIANRHQADLFISVHVNASPSSVPYGTSTYVMGLKSIDKNMEVAKRENAVIAIEENVARKYKEFNSDSPENNIILKLRQSSNMEQSIAFASLVQQHFKRTAGRKSRGVYQAGLIVLYNLTMPGVLIETGFISNTNEERWLNTAQGQNAIARSIFRAFSAYKSRVEAKSTGDFALSKNNKPTKIKRSTKTKKNNTPAKEPQPQEEEANEPLQDEQLTQQTTPVFKVQFKTHPEKLPENAAHFKGLTGVEVYQDKGVYKYTVGRFATLQEAVAYQKEVRKTFSDAFVVAFLQNKRISIGRAKQLLEE